MGWDIATKKKNAGELQTELFVEMNEEEKAIMKALRADSDGLQVNQLVVTLNIPINRLLPMLFDMEMKGYIRAVAGGRYRATLQ